MTLNGDAVDAVSVNEALTNFIAWINKFENVSLVAHNGRRFDYPVLMSALVSVNLHAAFTSSVVAMIDSLTVFRKLYPGRSSYKQEELVKDLLQATYNAHNALDDVAALGRLVLSTKLSATQLMEHSFSTMAVLYSLRTSTAKANNLRSLDVLVSSGVCKRPTAENIAGSGLRLGHLQTIYDRDGEDGLINTFTVHNSEGQPRVTSSKRVLEAIIPKLVDFFNNQKKQ